MSLLLGSAKRFRGFVALVQTGRFFVALLTLAQLSSVELLVWLKAMLKVHISISA